MVKKIVLIFTILLSVRLSAQKVDVIKFAELQKKIHGTDFQLTVFNFWATWCGPCIKELPYFDELGKNGNIKVYLVSVDFQNEVERVKKFVAKKSFTSKVLFLDEKNPDTYISKVSEEWSGAIPATLFVTKMKRMYFYEKAFTKEELEKIIKKIFELTK